MIGLGFKQSQGDHTLLNIKGKSANSPSSLCWWYYSDWKLRQKEGILETETSPRIWTKRAWKTKVLPRDWNTTLAKEFLYLSKK